MGTTVDLSIFFETLQHWWAKASLGFRVLSGIILYTPLFSRTVIFAVLARCGNSRVVNFAILLMLSLL